MKIPSGKAWFTHTDSYFPGGTWDRAGVACLNNGDVYVFDINMHNNMIGGIETSSLYGFLYKRRSDGTYLRLTPDGQWAHPKQVSNTGNAFDSIEGYLPEIALVIDTNSFASPMSHDGVDLYFQGVQQGKLYHLDTATLQLSLWIGTAPAAATSTTATNSGLGSTSTINSNSAQFIRIGDHLYWMDRTVTSTANLNHIRRVSVSFPHGTETITPSSWTTVPSWFSTQTDIARPNASTRLPNGLDPDSHVNGSVSPTTHGLAYHDGYFYFFQAVAWNAGFPPSWFDGTAGGMCALRRWKWPDPSTGNQADIETLYYATGRGVVTDFVSQPEGASTGDYFFRDGLGDEMLEGFRILQTDLHVKDGYLLAHNWGGVTQSGFRYGQALIRFNIEELVAQVAETGGPLLHDRENPFYETINQETGWWVGGGDYTWSTRDRWQNYRDGGDPISHKGYCTFDVGKGPVFDDKILLLTSEIDNVWMNQTYIHALRVLSPSGPPTTFDLTLSFEGVRMKGYQRQNDIHDLHLPEVVTLS